MDLTLQEFISEVLEYSNIVLNDKMKKFSEWKIENLMLEGVEATRYSVEVNYRTNIKSVLENYAKIVLGYVSAALKQSNFHVKHVYTENPLRIIISSRNWDDGEWCVVVTFNPNMQCFIISKGFYNKRNMSVSVQSSAKCAGDSAVEITKDVKNAMHNLKDIPNKHVEKIKALPLKRGPKG